MSLVVRISADISALSQGFQQAIQAADAFEKKLFNLGQSGAGFGNLTQDLKQISQGLGGAGLKIHAFAKDAAVATRALTQAINNLTVKLGPLATALDKATNSMSRFSQAVHVRLPQATAAIRKFSDEAKDAIDPVTGLFNQMSAGVRQAGRAANSLNGVSSATQSLSSVLSENTSLWTRFTVALGGALIGSMVSQVFWRLGDALLRLPGLMIELAGSLEQTKIALNTMVGEGAKADKFLRDLQAFAVETPFEFEGLMKSAKMLMAMGINSKAILPILRAVGDSLAAVGGTSYQIENVSRALAQMAAKGKLNAEELNQLAENGIPAVDMLAKKIGVSTGKIMEMAEKSQLAAAKYLPMLINEMESRFTGMMEKQNKTITGSLAMLSDAFKLTFGEIGKRLIELTGLTEKVRALASAFMALGKSVREIGLPGLFMTAFGTNSRNAMIGTATAIGAIAYAATRMGIAFLATVPALKGVRDALRLTAIATIKQTLLFAAIGAVAFAIGVNLKWLGERAGIFANAWQAYFYGVGQNMANFASVVWSTMKAAGYAITGNFDAAKASIGDVGKSLELMVSDTKAALSDAENAFNVPLKESFVNPLTEAQKAWSSFTGLFNEKAAGMKLGTEKLTKEMMGIAGGIDAVKGKDMSKELERQANRAMATKNAYEALQTSLQGIIAKEIELGYAYDENRAIADALSPVISALTAQYGKKSKQVQDLIKTQQLYRKLSVEVSQVEQRRYKDLQQILAVGTRLSANLKEIADDAEDQGRSFNAAERQAKAYKVALKELRNIKIGDNAGLTQFVKGMDLSKIPNVGDGIIKGIVEALKKGDKTQIEKAFADLIGALDLKAAQFDVGKIVDDATRQFDIAKARALALGEAFDEVAERVKMETQILEKLTENGTKPAIAATEEHKKKLQELRDQLNNSLAGWTNFAGLMNAAFSAVKTVDDLLSIFGANIGDATKAAVDFGIKFATAIAATITAIVTLGVAWKTMSDTLKADPLYLTLSVIAIALVGIIGLVKALQNSEEERNKAAKKFNDEYISGLKETNTRLTETVENAAQSYEARGEIVRMLTDEELQGVQSLMDKYDDLDRRLSESAQATAETQQQLRDELKKTVDELNAALPAAVQTSMRKSNNSFGLSIARWRKSATDVAAEAAAKISNSLKGGIIDSLKSAGKAFLEGAEDWQYKLRQGIRDAVISGIVDAMVKKSIIDVIMPDVERLANTLQRGLYVDPSEVRAIFNKADTLGRSLESVLGPVRDVITGFKVEAPTFNEAFAGVIGGANQLMNVALAAGDIAGIGRAAAQFQAAQGGAYGSQYNDITINFQGRGTGITEQEAREMGQKIVDQLRRAGKT